MAKKCASLLLAVAIILSICSPALAVDVESVSLFGRAKLLSGTSTKISAVVNPQNALDSDLIWTTSNAAASVNPKGMVTARDVDDVTKVIITATASNGVSGEHEMSIHPRAMSVEITPSRATIDLSDGFIQFEAKVYPRTAEQEIVWSVSGRKTATITSDGLFSAKKKGVVTVRAKVLGQESVMATARVEISRLITSITLKGATRLKSGKKTKLDAIVIPKIKKRSAVLWECLTPDIAKVSKSGRVTALSVSEEQVAVIRAYARANPDVSATYEITVFPAAE